jgi:ABC-type phosphate/phosphonate transport system substrate-binding protein
MKPNLMASQRLLVSLAILPILALSAGAALAADSAPKPWTRPAAPLRIGYMEPETASPLNQDWFRGLKLFLETDRGCAGLRAAMAGRYDGFALVAAEGYNDLVRRMRAMEFDVVFCPAVAFAQQVADSFTTDGRYTVVFQIKGPTDIGREPQRSGVIIVNRNHPLFRSPKARASGRPVDEAELARRFAIEPVALVSRYSAAGYIDPMNRMLDAIGPSAWPTQPIFCGSSEDVVKMVLSDVVWMGACEKGSVEQVMRLYGIQTPKDQAVDELVTMPGSPTDPIAFRWELRPRPGAELGRLLKAALSDYVYFSGNQLGGLRLEESEDRNFRPLKQALAKFDRYAPGGGR